MTYAGKRGYRLSFCRLMLSGAGFGVKKVVYLSVEIYNSSWLSEAAANRMSPGKQNRWYPEGTWAIENDIALDLLGCAGRRD